MDKLTIKKTIQDGQEVIVIDNKAFNMILTLEQAKTVGTHLIKLACPECVIMYEP